MAILQNGFYVSLLLCSFVVWKAVFQKSIHCFPFIELLWRLSMPTRSMQAKSLSMMLLVMILIHGPITSLLTRTLPSRLYVRRSTEAHNTFKLFHHHHLVKLPSIIVGLALPCSYHGWPRKKLLMAHLHLIHREK